MIRISQIKMNLGDSEDLLRKKVMDYLNISSEDILEYIIHKKSVDARKKNKIQFSYTLDVKIMNEEEILRKNKKLVKTVDYEYKSIKHGTMKMKSNPVIIGAGPCGLFAAWILATEGYKPIVIERGKEVDSRTNDVNRFWSEGVLNPESNVQFGEGGAGTFSDGKLTTRTKDPLCRKVLEVLVENGAPENILYEAKPHVGTDILKNVVKEMRNNIIRMGGEFKYQTKLTNLYVEKNSIESIEINNLKKIDTDNVILAIGHSARDTFEMLYNNKVSMVAKPFAVGVRIEHPQVLINKSQYGESYEHPDLGAADYHLTYQTKKDRAVYTFCMCPGGHVVAASSEPNSHVVNGMSYHKRDGINANSALLVSVTPNDYPSENPLSGIEFQRKIERDAFRIGGSNYNAPVQRVADFMVNKKSEKLGKVKTTYKPNYTLSNLNDCLPSFISESLREALPEMGKKIKKFDLEDAVMVGVETRSSSPLRILRNKETLESENIYGLYPAGEGSGYSGGIMSSAVDGIKVAEKIIIKYKNF